MRRREGREGKGERKGKRGEADTKEIILYEGKGRKR